MSAPDRPIRPYHKRRPQILIRARITSGHLTRVPPEHSSIRQCTGGTVKIRPKLAMAHIRDLDEAAMFATRHIQRLVQHRLGLIKC
jgi:hypothetical protein